MNIQIAPTGKVVKGNVLDCAVRALEETLRYYDPQLYVRWSPKKLRGWGCWEVRRRPELKSYTGSVVFQGNTIVCLGYREYGMESHIMDVPYLNYKILERLKSIDTWSQSYKAKNFAKELEYNEAKAQEKLEDRSEEDKRYMVKQHKGQIRDMMEFVNAGGNPYRIADYWNK